MKLLKTMKRKLKDEAGQVLPMALILLVLGGLLVVPTLSFMTTNLTANMAVDQANLRLYAADAGIQYAFQQFAYDVDFNPAGPLEFPPELNPVNGYNVSLDKQPAGDLAYKITSVAYDPVADKTTTIEAYFLANAAQYEVTHSPFDYAVTTLGGDLTMTGSSTISSDCSPTPCNEGNVWVNGDIILGWSNTIAGEATITGTCNREGNVLGGVVQGEAPERPAWLDNQVDCYIASTNVAAPVCGSLPSGDWDRDAGTYGAVNVAGNMTIGGGGTYTFTGPVCIGGNLTIRSGANFVTFQKPVKVGGYASFGGTGWVKFENPAPASTINYGSHAIGTVEGSGIYISGDSASAILTSGTCSSGGAVNVQLQDSDDNSIWTDVSPCGALPLVTEINDNGTYRQNYTGTKPYLRAVATVSGANCQFGVSIVKNTTLYIGKYLEVSGSRSAWFDGPVIVSGAALTGGKIVNIGGSKYSGVAWDIVLRGTLRATEPIPNCSHNIYLGGSKVFEFYDVVYTNVSAEIAGATGSNMTFTKAFIADCNIAVSGSSSVDAPATTSPIFVSRYGNVDLSGATMVDAIVYAPEGNVHVSGSSQLEGAIVAESALLEGNVRLKYPVIFRERDDVHPEQGGEPGESLFSIVSYSIQ
jgi:hypothetical protein